MVEQRWTGVKPKPAAASSVANVVPKGLATAAAVAKASAVAAVRASAVAEAVASAIVAVVATNFDADKNWPVNDKFRCFCIASGF